MIVQTKKHPNFPNYLFYNDGRIQNNRKLVWLPKTKRFIKNPFYKKFLKPHKNKVWQSYMLGLIDKKTGIQQSVHIARIIATLFVKKPKRLIKEKYLVVQFKDQISSNVDYKNLYWMSRTEYNTLNNSGFYASKKRGIKTRLPYSTKPIKCFVYNENKKLVHTSTSKTSCAKFIGVGISSIAYAIEKKTLCNKKYYITLKITSGRIKNEKPLKHKRYGK